MSLVNTVVQRLKRDYFRWQHGRAAARILRTVPVRKGELPFILLSMVQKRDVISYLVAVKSFTHFANPQRIVVVCDPSIDDADRRIFRAHVPHIELRQADEFTHANIPRGGTWERLYAIAGYAATDYVVQLDADTVTTAPIPEVIAAVQARNGFVIVEKTTTIIRTLDDTRAITLSKSRPNPHVQSLSEAAMATVGLPPDARYVRGCSGFTGFPPNPAMREQMLDYSARMYKELGENWKRWGTEQVTSNYLVANAHGVVTLPFPKYGTPNVLGSDMAFCHFIGSMRFIDGKYVDTSARVIQLIG